DFVTSRRHLLLTGAGLVAALGLPKAALADATKVAEPPAHQPAHKGSKLMTTATMKDGAKIYFKDWGVGPVVTFSHGWPLSADAWDAQMLFLAQRGYRVIAHDRRGHGRSEQTWTGNDMDTYADDLAELLEKINVNEITMVGHSTGGGEVARYIGRHGNGRVRKVVLISAVPPVMLRSDHNPNGLPLSVFDEIRTGVEKNRAQYFRELSLPFYGYNKPDAKTSEGVC